MALTSTRTATSMAEHMEELREYAGRAVTGGAPLSQYDELEKTARLDELFRLGVHVGCTEKELVILLFKGLFDRRPGCDCFTCRSRRETRQLQ